MMRRGTMHALVALLYSAVYIATYNRYLSEHFGYAGFTPYDRAPGFLLWSVVLTVLPVLFYRRVQGVAGVIAVLIYYILYVPIVLTFALGSSKAIDEIMILQMLFCLSMAALFAADWVAIRPPINLRTKLNLLPPTLVLTIGITIWVVVEYWGNLRFVSFGAAVYEQRFANAELGTGIVIRYLSSWLSMLFAPLCLAFGIVARRPFYFVVGTAACVVTYLATAAKFALLLPLFFLAVAAVFGGGRLRWLFPATCLLLSGAVVLLSRVQPGESAAFLVSSLLLYRILGNSGLLTVLYYDFFTFFPQTNYTHINIVGSVLGSYPYGNQGLGQVIGDFFFNDRTNANANFWATDGFAAAGALGLVAVSVLVAILFVAINAVTRGYNRHFVVLCFLPFTLSLLNTSVFSTLWSGGGLLLLAFFVFNRHDATIAEAVSRGEPRSLLDSWRGPR